MLGLSIPGVAYRNTSSLAARVNALFRAGEQGVWYDPSDRATLFQDAAGTTPVTAVEQPVGLILDKSGRGNHAYQSTSASRPVLSARVNQYIGTATLATQNVTTLAATYTLRFEGTGSIALSGTATGTYAAGTHSVVCTAGTLTSTVTGTVTNADIRVANVGVGLPVYQRVTTSTDYDTVSYPFFLRFDGVDDFLITNSINFTATDKMTVVAGFRKLNDAGVATVVEMSSNYAYAGTFAMFAPAQVGQSDVSLGLNGSAGSTPPYARIMGLSAPASVVVSCAYDLAQGTRGAEIRPRVNGAMPDSIAWGNPTISAGTGNFGNYPLYIGRRGGTTMPFNGHIYSLIVRGAQSSDSQITSVERYVNGKTKAYA